MQGSLSNKERRQHPRFIIDLPLEYRDMNDSCLRGAIVVNASDGGFLIESPQDIPVGTELNITVLFPKGFRLDNLKVVAKIVWKKPYQKGDWQGNQCWGGYQYGLKYIQILAEDRWKLNSLLGGRFNLEQKSTNNGASADRKAGA
jgi:hypothetical protein